MLQTKQLYIGLYHHNVWLFETYIVLHMIDAILVIKISTFFKLHEHGQVAEKQRQSVHCYLK